YLDLLRFGVPGEVYNVAGGAAVSLRELFERLAKIVGHAAVAVPDPELVRPADIPHLVGDGSKLRALSEWRPKVDLHDALVEVADAQAH
ncbi:MAG: GDP-4-dehydro-6-deoxy-D-mannose reductase, partial [Gemmatimonadales bacterium]|nr:GDP-4-dehydro-6-deoxy-D-mannose reductase [Gemmatimonadales bacterium]